LENLAGAAALHQVVGRLMEVSGQCHTASSS
jgi:hypothetical protein